MRIKKYCLTCIVAFVSFFWFTSYAQLSENFSDGDLTNNPAWQGSTSYFSVNSSKQLQSNGSVADTIYLSTSNTKIIDAEWQFWVKLNFNPSEQNFVKIYLSSDQADLTGSLNGYFIRIGENLALDGIDLFKQNGTTITSLINGIDAHGAVKPVLRIRVVHRLNGDWELYSDTSGGTDFIAEGTANDNSITTTGYFGVLCGFTVSNIKNFYFDDIYAGNIIVDTTGPELLNVFVQDSSTLSIVFNEELDPQTASVVANYTLNKGIGNPLSATLAAPGNLVDLKLNKPLTSLSDYNIRVEGIKDLHNNFMSVDSVNFLPFFPAWGNVIINEVFADPTPSVGLPQSEYIEIFNTLSYTGSLLCQGWKLADATSSILIPDFYLEMNDHIILCDIADTSLYKSFGKTIGINGFQTLNNDGDLIILKSTNGNIIDEIEYKLSWYQDKAKEEGGYSLERINPYITCSDQNNWMASKDAMGGSPGKQNSVYSDLPDQSSPFVEGFEVIDSMQIMITFNEMMDQYSLTNPLAYTINPGKNHPQTISILNNNKSVNLKLQQPITKGSIYELEVSGVIDCSANPVKQNNIRFGLPEPADSSDLVINEILFNPHPNGYDFVELYNRSAKVLSLKNLKICSFDSNNNIKTPYFLSVSSGQLLPGEYLAVTENKEDILNSYYVKKPENIIELPSLPSFNDDEGKVGILNSSNVVIDKFFYNESYHFKLIDNEEGVSLERISPEFKTQDPVNWTSAASSVGYATPAYQNSHYQTETPVSDKVSIDPQTFSPDNDGFQDELMIRLYLDRPNYFGSISIFDLSGREVRKLVNNDLFGDENLYKWDGIDNNGTKAPIGVYIILFEISNTDGTTEKIKKTCTLAAK